MEPRTPPTKAPGKKPSGKQIAELRKRNRGRVFKGGSASGPATKKR